MSAPKVGVPSRVTTDPTASPNTYLLSGREDRGHVCKDDSPLGGFLSPYDLPSGGAQSLGPTR